jgi:hypothetical protein
MPAALKSEEPRSYHFSEFAEHLHFRTDAEHGMDRKQGYRNGSLFGTLANPGKVVAAWLEDH